MGDLPSERRTAPRFAATFRIRLGYPDLNAFLEGYAVNISKGGIYVPTKQAREKGTEVRFELLLKDGSTAVSGVGRVAWSKAFDPAKPGERYGMGVQFVTLEGASDEIVKQALAWREKHVPAAVGTPSIPPPPPDEKPAAGPPPAVQPEPEKPAVEAPAPAEAQPEPKPEPREQLAAPVEPEAKPESPAPPAPPAEPVAEAQPAPAAAAPAKPVTGPHAIRKPAGAKKVSLGEVDDLLASLRAKKGAKPFPRPLEPRPSDKLEPLATATPAPAEPEPPKAEPQAERKEPPAADVGDENLPSLDDLEAALASVSHPPPKPSLTENSSPEIPILEGAPAVAHGSSADDAPHDPDGLALPSWDEERPVQRVSDRMVAAPGGLDEAQIPGSALPEEGQSEILEAVDDMDVDSLPLRAAEPGIAVPDESEIGPASHPASVPPAGELFGGLPGDATAPLPATPSQPELPLVGGVVPENVDEAIRRAILSKAGEPADEDAETSVMSNADAAAMAASMAKATAARAGGRPSLADLPPPPDMPAPIPSGSTPPSDEKKKRGLFGKLFGRKDQK